MTRFLCVLQYVSMAFFVSLVFAGLAMAEEPAAAVSTSPGVFTLGEMVVSAKSEKLSTGESRIGERELRQFNADNLADALNLMPGVTFSRSGARNEQTVYVRGLDIKHVPVFIDGIPVYVLYDGYPDLGRFTTFDLSQIVLSKGLTSVLYGPNTMGGAINMVSRRPEKPFEGTAGIGVAGGETFTSYANIGSNLGRWYFQLGASYADQNYFRVSDDFKPTEHENGGRRENSYRTDQKLNFKVGFTPDGEDEYTLGYINQKADKGSSPYAGTDPSQIVRYWRWPQWDKESFYFTSRTGIGSQSYTKVRLYHDSYKNALSGYDDATYTTQQRGFGWSQYDDRTFGGSLEVGTLALPRNDLKAVFHYKRDNHKERDRGEPWQTFRDHIFSIGLEDTFEVTDRLYLVAGASYDWIEPSRAEDYQSDKISEFEKDDSSAFNPQLGLVYDLASGGSLRASIACKSRLPDMKSRYSYRFGRALPNPGLSAEKSVNYEVGYENNWDDRLQFRTALFYQDISDYILSVTVDELEQNRNVGDVDIYGVEAEVAARLFSTLLVGLNYTYTHWDNNSGADKLTDIPRHKFFSWLRYQPVDRLTLQTSLEYGADRYSSSDGNRKAGSYTVVNAKAGFNLFKGLELEVGVSNLFDKDYAIDEGYPEAGVTCFANLTYQY